MKRLLILFSLIALGLLPLLAVDIVIIGQVMSAVDGSPLESAHVWFKDTDIGTTTNKDGFFMLRSPEPQHSVMVSVVGYRRRNIKLNYGKDEMLEIFLREDINLLDEIFVMPGENPAMEIVRELIAHKDENNPEHIVGVSYDKTTMTTIDLTSVKQKALQRRLLKDLERGRVSVYDSTMLLPVYAAQYIDSVCRLPDRISETPLYIQEKAFEMLTVDQWNSYLNSYLADANFYKNYITLFDKTFVSPLSVQAKSFYNYLLTDSVVLGGETFYEISFYPKNEKHLVFKGKMLVDKERHALVRIEATLLPSANINFVNGLNFLQRFQRVGDRYFYLSKMQSASLSFSTISSSTSLFGALLLQSSHYSNMQILGDSIESLSVPSYLDRVPAGGLEENWNRIDSINQTRIQKLAYNITDMVINGYAHVWKLDIGPLLNFFTYNRLVGAQPLISLRTGQRLWPNVTVGGYVGYGFGDHKWKYGGEFQWRFGKSRDNILGVFYDRRIFRYGFDQVNLYQENKVEQYDHLFNWLFSTNAFPFNALRERATLQYRYEQGGVRAVVEARGEKTFGNEFIPFIQNGNLVNDVASASLWTNLRFSYKEQSLDNYFRRHYLRSKYPVVNLVLEGGYYSVGDVESPYGSLRLVVNQRLPMVYGKLHYTVDAAWIVGAVPFPKLFITRGTRGWYYTPTNFALLGQSEFCSDRYIGGHFRYETSGWLFNMIPYVKKLNMRENVIFNIGYGALERSVHDRVLVIPTFMKSFDLPYMEVGFGISNILNLITVDSFWRLTYRHDADGPLWGIRARLDLNF